MAQKYAVKYIKDFAAHVYSLPTKSGNEDVDFEIFEDNMDRYIPACRLLSIWPTDSLAMGTGIRQHWSQIVCAL